MNCGTYFYLDLRPAIAPAQALLPDVRAAEVVPRVGHNTATDNPDLVAALVAAGALEVPIAATFPLDAVRTAFALLEQGHTLGKIVLQP